MNRKFKNIIMITVLSILIGCNIVLINESRNVAKHKQEVYKNQIESDWYNPKEEIEFYDNDEIKRIPEEKMREPIKELHTIRTNKIKFIINNILIALITIYLFMSKFNKIGLKETLLGNNLIIYILSTILLVIVLTSGCNYFANTLPKVKKEEPVVPNYEATQVEKELINLEEFNSNITLTESKEYTIKGKFNHSVFINAKGKVILNLDGVEITSEETSAIANISGNELTVNVKKDTVNNLKDNGNSDYDGCLYSNGPLTIEGEGVLNIKGNQEDGEGIATTDNDITINGGTIIVKSDDDGINAGGDKGGIITINGGMIYIKAKGDGIDSNDSLVINDGLIYTSTASSNNAAIDTDKGYEINGGTVIAIGKSMLQSPSKTSKQNSLVFMLENKINKNTLITLLNNNDNVIVSFEAKEDFKTLIISKKSLLNDTYYLYIDGAKTEYSKVIK